MESEATLIRARCTTFNLSRRMRKRVHISGERGRWLARAEGRLLPVIHSSWRRGLTGYLDPMTGAKLDGQRYAEFVAALKEEALVIVQKDKTDTLDRESYIGIFRFTGLQIGGDGSVALTLTQRYADPA